MTRTRRHRPPVVAVPPLVSLAALVVALLWAAFSALEVPQPAALALTNLGEAALPLLPRDARTFVAAKEPNGESSALIAALSGAGREPSAVVRAAAQASGSAPNSGELASIGAAIQSGESPDATVWTTAGHAGFAALMAGRFARTDLVPQIEAMVAAPPSPADAAAGRYALSRLRR